MSARKTKNNSLFRNNKLEPAIIQLIPIFFIILYLIFRVLYLGKFDRMIFVFLILPFLFLGHTLKAKPWDVLGKETERVRTTWSLMIAYVISSFYITIEPINNWKISLGLSILLGLAIFWLIYSKFSEKFLSKALENGGLLWREKK